MSLSEFEVIPEKGIMRDCAIYIDAVIFSKSLGI